MKTLVAFIFLCLLPAGLAPAEPPEDAMVFSEEAFAAAPPLAPVAELAPPGPRRQASVDTRGVGAAREQERPADTQETHARSGGPATLTLKQEVFVRGPELMLGDVARIDGAGAEQLASVSLGPAAVPGSSKHLHAGLVQARLETAGVDPDAVRLGGARSVTATTLHLEITRQALESSLKDYILAVMPWDPMDTEITITPPSTAVIVPEGQVDIDWRPNPQYRYVGASAFRGQINVNGAPASEVLCRAHIEAYVDVVMAAREVPRGRIIQQGDLELQKRAVSLLRPGTLRNADEAIGQVARSNIFPGAVLTSRNVERPTLVRRNQQVSVRIQNGGLSVQAQARALQDGAAGDLVQFMNEGAEETFFARIQPDGTAVLE